MSESPTWSFTSTDSGSPTVSLSEKADAKKEQQEHYEWDPDPVLGPEDLNIKVYLSRKNRVRVETK